MSETPSDRRENADPQPINWRLCDASSVRTLRHLLAGHSVAEVAKHYGVSASRVRNQMWALMGVARSHGHRCDDAGQLKVLATRDGLEPTPLPECVRHVP